MKKRKHVGERTECKLPGPLGFANQGDFIKVEIGGSLALARVTGVQVSRRVLQLQHFDPPLEMEGQRYLFAVNMWQEDLAGVPVSGLQRSLLPAKTKAEAEVMFQRQVKRAEEFDRARLNNYRAYASMQADEQDTHKAQLKALKGVWPATLEAIEKGADPRKDYNAESIAMTGSPSLPIEAGDAEAMDKILSAQNLKREMDPVDEELLVNWLERYSHMKPEEYTASINGKLGTNISVSAMKSRAITKFRLASRRAEGRPAHDGELPPG